jgi:hypothetical protein
VTVSVPLLGLDELVVVVLFDALVLVVLVAPVFWFVAVTVVPPVLFTVESVTVPVLVFTFTPGAVPPPTNPRLAAVIGVPDALVPSTVSAVMPDVLINPPPNTSRL